MVVVAVLSGMHVLFNMKAVKVLQLRRLNPSLLRTVCAAWIQDRRVMSPADAAEEEPLVSSISIFGAFKSTPPVKQKMSDASKLRCALAAQLSLLTKSSKRPRNPEVKIEDSSRAVDTAAKLEGWLLQKGWIECIHM